MLCHICNEDIPLKSYGRHVAKCKGGRQKKRTFSNLLSLKCSAHDDDDNGATHHESGDHYQSFLLNKKQKTVSNAGVDNSDDNSCIDFDGCGACGSPVRECDMYFAGVDEARQEGFNEYNELLSNESSSSDEEHTSEDDYTAKVPSKESKKPFDSDICLPNSHKFQIELHDLMGRHRTCHYLI